MRLPEPREVATRRRNQLLRALLLTALLFGSFELSSANGADLKPITFLGDKDYPPIAYLEDGLAKGMDVDLARALGQRLQREVRIELMDWNPAQEKILRGEGDGLLGTSITEERRKLFDFAAPTFTREFGLLVRKGDVTVRGATDLKGKKVGVTAGGFPRRFLETRPGINLVVIDNYQDGFKRLNAETIDVLAADLWVAAYLMEKSGIRGVTIVGKPFATAPSALAVKKGNAALLEEINRGVQLLKADGKVREIEEQWKPQEMLFVSREKARILFTLLAVVLFVILLVVMGVWILTLKKQIRVRRAAESSLRASEERFQLAVRGSADGLWDRNILTNEVFFAERYRELLGYSANEFPGEFASFESSLHPEDKERVLRMVAAHLERREPYDAEYRLRTKSGDYRWFRGRGQAIWDEQGRAVRMAGSITDVTERKQAEEGLNLLQMITMDVTVAKDLPSALEVVLRRVCEKTGWALGQAWIPNAAGTALGCCPAWFAPAATLGDFRTASTETSFDSGSGLPGRVWECRQPIWVRDVTMDLNFPRAEAAQKAGLKAGLGVPILSGDEVLAVLEFFLKEPRSEDEHLVKMIGAVAAQIGLVIERKRAEEQLRWSEEQLRLLLDSTAEGIFGVDLQGRCTFCNAAGVRLLGYESPADLLGREMHSLIAHSRIDGTPYPGSECPVVQSLQSGSRVSAGDDVFWRKDRTNFPAEYWSYPIYRECKHIGAVVTFLDITERKRAEEALRKSEEKFSKVFASAPAAMAVTRPSDQRILDVNREFTRLLGYSREEAIGHSTVELGLFLNPQDREHLLQIMSRDGDAKDFELHLRARNGSIVIGRYAGQLADVNGEMLALSAFVDITARKRAEEEVRASREQLRALAGRLQDVREEERTRIAREIHDVLAQELTGLKIDLGWLGKRLPDPEVDRRTLAEKVAALSGVVDTAISTVQKIAAELRPVVLDSLGLSAAIEWQAEEFQQRTGIQCEVIVPDEDLPLSRECATGIFRIVQESLTNVIRHSHATIVEIILEWDDDQLRLLVQDNGVGFDEAKMKDRHSLGLLGMKERALLLGGQFEIRGAPGKGTRVSVTIQAGRASMSSGAS